MNIKEVLKEENIDKEYKFGERIYKVVKSFNEILTGLIYILTYCLTF